MIQEVPIHKLNYDQLVTIIEAMTDEDKKHLNEMRRFRLSEALYLYILQQASLDGQTFDEWVRSACISYAFNRMTKRNVKKKLNAYLD